MAHVVSIDFEIVPPERAVIPAMDRSFLYGDSVYEVVRTYGGDTLFLLEKHYERLLRSAERICLCVPFTCDRLLDHGRELVGRSGNADSYMRIVVSRGTDHRFALNPPEGIRPRTVMFVAPLPGYPPEYFDKGITVSLVSVRRNLRTAVDPNIKTGNYMNNMMALMEAHRNGAVDAIMLNNDDEVTEGTTSNVFIVFGGVVRTPPVESGLLEGVSRALLKDLMTREGVLFEETPIPRAMFDEADEVFLTGTTKEVMPVRRVDDRIVGDGLPGPVTARLMKLFHDEVKAIVGSSVTGCRPPERT